MRFLGGRVHRQRRRGGDGVRADGRGEAGDDHRRARGRYTHPVTDRAAVQKAITVTAGPAVEVAGHTWADWRAGSAV
ncbi:hypothetical protein BFF78_06870 [Streptomyces fodineus]|uniref:Bacterial Ig domain-containing protein n=1 Tax=Streptomyces fodineus TaxID=1904616 RepID=A0A1D7Y5R7_9ACTN|nr:hypothetical protein BFF78_06870 [Streptomyces fodineus]